MYSVRGNRFYLHPLGKLDWGETHKIPKYSTSLEDSYELLTSNVSRFVFLRSLSSCSGDDFRLCRSHPHQDQHWVEYITPSGLTRGPIGCTMPHSICLAALESVLYNIAQN